VVVSVSRNLLVPRLYCIHDNKSALTSCLLACSTIGCKKARTNKSCYTQSSKFKVQSSPVKVVWRKYEKKEKRLLPIGTRRGMVGKKKAVERKRRGLITEQQIMLDAGCCSTS